MCPLCDSNEVNILGQLGRLVWYRCRSCGIDFNQPKPEIHVVTGRS